MRLVWLMDVACMVVEVDVPHGLGATRHVDIGFVIISRGMG